MKDLKAAHVQWAQFSPAKVGDFEGCYMGMGGILLAPERKGGQWWTFIFEKHSTRKIVDFSTVKHGKNGD